MVWIFFLIALIASICLLPEGELRKVGVIIPDQARRKRVWQGLLFAGLILAMLALRLAPFALLLFLVGLGVIANSAWQEKAVGDDLRDKPEQGTGTYTPSIHPRTMSVDEAHDVLGLKPGATGKEIDVAYRHLMAQIHPDKGGTDYLAAKINEARDIIKKQLSGGE